MGLNLIPSGVTEVDWTDAGRQSRATWKSERRGTPRLQFPEKRPPTGQTPQWTFLCRRAQTPYAFPIRSLRVRNWTGSGLQFSCA